MAANRGQAVHRFLEEIGIGVPYEAALDRVPDPYRSLCAKLDTFDLIPGGGEHEAAFKWNCEAGVATYLGKSKGRDYGDLEDCEVPGTIDWYRINSDALLLRDYKTGRTKHEDTGFDSQLLFFALCLSYLHPAIEKIRGQLARIQRDGTHRYETAALPKERIAKFAASLHEMHRGRMAAREAIAGGKDPEVKEGKHCSFCPSKKWCPAKEKKRELKRLKKGI